MNHLSYHRRKAALVAAAILAFTLLFGLLLGRSCASADARAVQTLAELVRDLMYFQSGAAVLATGIVAASTILAAVLIPVLTVYTAEKARRKVEAPRLVALVEAAKKPEALKSAENPAGSLAAAPGERHLPPGPELQKQQPQLKGRNP